MPTIIANLTVLRVGLPAARAVAVAVAGIIWVCFRRSVTNPGTSALLVGTFLATLMALSMTCRLVANAALPVVLDERRMHSLLPITEASILVWSLILPVLMVETWRTAAIESIPLILLFGLIFLARRYVPRSGAAPTEETVSIG